MTTGVEWADETSNPTVGCEKEKQSEGCDRCYAEAIARRGMCPAHAAATTGARWNGDIIWQPRQVEKYATWGPVVEKSGLKRPRRIFIGSMTDIALAPYEMFLRIWNACQASPHHRYMFLTKRPELLLLNVVASMVEHDIDVSSPPRWLWVGVTTENQRRADERIEVLHEIPAAVRFVSAEPMLEDIEDFGPQRLDWVICGGETGPGARPMKLSWARRLRDRCRAAGVPFFFKKVGRGIATPDDLLIREFPDV